MNWLKKNKLLLLFLVLVYVSYFLFQYKPHQVLKHVVGIKNNLTLFEEPEDGKEPILTAIKDATREIHIEMYLLSDKQIIDELIQEKHEGTDVRVMLEEHPFGGGNINIKTKKTLENAYIPVIWTNPAYALTHEKAIVIDDKKALILNQNLTTSSFGKNREFDIVDENLEDVSEIERMFEADWQRQSFTPNTSGLIISPYNSRAKLTSLLMNTTKSLDIEMEIIQDPEVGQILAEKAKTANVRLIVPDIKKVPSNYKTVNKLKENGVMVRTITNPYIHAKLILTDGLKAYIGSVNFSTQSMDENRELGIVITSTDIIQKLTTSFDHDWKQATELE